MTYGMGRSLSYLDRFDVEKLLEEAEERTIAKLRR